MRWLYLVRMEPVSTVEMYVKAWLESLRTPVLLSMTASLHQLPVAKRRAIYEALIRCVQEQGGMVKRLSGISEEELRYEVLPRLQSAYKRVLQEEAQNKIQSDATKPTKPPEPATQSQEDRP